MNFRRRASVALIGCLSLRIASVDAADWPQWFGPQRDGVWRETGIVEQLPANPNYRWRVAIGSGYAGPAVAHGRVFVMDRQLATGAGNPADPFAQGTIPGTERVLCLDEATGAELWQHEYAAAYTVSYAAGPRATPTVDEERVYTLGAEGHLKCLDVATGAVKWEKHFAKDYGVKTATWGWSSAPLVDGDLLISIVGGDGSVVVAFDKRTGREMWRALSAKEPGYGTPVIFELNGRRHLIAWHPEAVVGLDPQTGQVLWTHPWVIRYALTAPTPRQSGSRIFLTSFYNGSLLLDLASGQPEVIWQSDKISEKDTDKLNSIISTPVIAGDTIYGVCSYGQLRGLSLKTGERLWEELTVTAGPRQERWGNAFIIPHGDRYFLFNEQGDLIHAKLSPSGYEELGRLHLIEPDNRDARTRNVVWSHPAFANGHILVRNDHELVSVSLRK